MEHRASMDTADLDWLAAEFRHLPMQLPSLRFLGEDADVEAARTGYRFALPDRHQGQRETVVPARTNRVSFGR